MSCLSLPECLDTPNGEKTLARAFLPTVTLGSVSGNNLEVLVDRPEAVAALDPKLRGILGQNFLAQFDLLLDYKQQLVTLSAAPSPDEAIAGTHIPFLWEHGRPLLIAKGSNGADLHLLLDSGSSNLWIFTREASGFLSDPAGRDAAMQTAAKATSAIRGMVTSLSLGNTRLRNVPALLIEQQTHESSVDGLLPTYLFQSVYFNNREGYAIVSEESGVVKKSLEAPAQIGVPGLICASDEERHWNSEGPEKSVPS